MRYERTPPGGFAVPDLHPLTQRVLVLAVAMYVTELVIVAFTPELYEIFAMWPLASGNVMPWQPITRWAVMGADPTWFFIGLLGLGFGLQAFTQAIAEEQRREVTLVVIVGSAVLPLLYDVLVGAGGPGLGWFPFVSAAFCLFGLAYADAVVNLMLVWPVEGRMIVWLVLGMDAIGVLASFSQGGELNAWASVSAWCAAYAWWHLRGPAARRRELLRQEANVMEELSRFTVHEGGKSDDVVH